MMLQLYRLLTQLHLPMKLVNTLLLAVVTTVATAQPTTTAKLTATTTNGLHSILVPTALRACANSNLSDLRIYDSKKTEVPYYMVLKGGEELSTNFERYTILSKTSIAHKSTTLIIELPKDKSLNELCLNVGTTDLNKQYSLSGSTNKTEWFGVSNNNYLTELSSATHTNVYTTINFALCNYTYLKLELNDSTTLPINVISVGNFKNKLQYNALQQLMPTAQTVQQKTANKTTLIELKFNASQVINQLEFTITSPVHYKRYARVYTTATRKIKRRTETYNQEITAFELNSNGTNKFTIPQLFANSFFIEIQNQDSPPLTIATVSLWQLPISIIADLRANETYSVTVGNSALTAPQYDLEYFKNGINTNLPTTTITDISSVNSAKANVAIPSFWQQAWFMWLCIGVGGLVLILFSLRLVKDMNVENT